MLTPDYLEKVPAAMMKLWQQVEEDILQDVARRIGKMDDVTATADWQPRRARPVDEAAKARLAQRSGFRKRVPPRAAKIG